MKHIFTFFPFLALLIGCFPAAKAQNTERAPAAKSNQITTFALSPSGKLLTTISQASRPTTPSGASARASGTSCTVTFSLQFPSAVCAGAGPFFFKVSSGGTLSGNANCPTGQSVAELSDGSGDFTKASVLISGDDFSDAINNLLNAYLPANLPTGTGYRVRLREVSTGFTSSSTGPLTINAAPSVTITPSTTAICQGQSAQLTATGANSYTWSTQQTTNPISVSSTGTYSVTVVNTAGCSGTASARLTVNPPPTVNLTNNGPLTCARTSVTLSASGTSGATYAFRNANGPIASSSNTASVSSPGTYTVTASLNGCTSTTITTVGINTTPPTVTISPSATAICAGQSVTLNTTATTSGGSLSYRWNTNATTPALSVSATGPYSVTVTRSDNGCVASATASVTVNPLPMVYAVTGGGAYCAGSNGIGIGLSNSQTGVNYQLLRGATAVGTPVAGTGTPFSFGNQMAAGTYMVLATNTSTGCQQAMNGSTNVTITPLPDAPALVTQSGQSYPAGVSSLTLSQNVGPVSLTVLGCSGGMITASGNAASSFTISTASTGTQTYTATCTQNGCTSLAASFPLTVVPTTLNVLHRDADYGNTGNNIIKPFLELANTGGQAIPYGDITVRYWFTSEGNAPPTNLAVYYTQLGAVNMNYVALSQPRQGAYGYVEYSFPAGGSLPANGNSGPIENGILKTDRSNFNETDDYSYQPNRDYLPNTRITAYRKGANGLPVIVWGQEPTPVASQTAVQVYSAAKDGGITSQIQTRLELRNTGSVALPVSGLKLRYYFTSDNGQPANVYVDYADLGSSNVQVHVVRLASPVNGADSYVELTFPGNPRQLSPLSSLGVIDFRLVRSDFGLLNQGNDYSYAPIYGPVGLNARVTAYLDNTLIFGTPPSGAPARIGVGEAGTVLQVKVLGNPVVGDQAQITITGVAGQAVSLRLVDLHGRTIHEQRIEQAGETDQVSLELGQSRGQLLLRVSTDSQQQSLKLMRP